jgi:membrane protein DedA with SNARE-associated domain
LDEQVDQFLAMITDLSAWEMAPLGFAALVASGLGLFSEDAVVAGLGLAALKGLLNPLLAIVICLVGILAADSLLYFAGRWSLGKMRLFRSLASARMGRARRLARRHGDKAIFLFRFVPWLRAPLFFASNRLGIHYGRFLLADALAALISIPLVMALSAGAASLISQLS